MVIEYRIVKKCGLCKGRFVVSRSESKRIYCDDCQKKVDRSNAEMIAKNDLAESLVKEEA